MDRARIIREKCGGYLCSCRQLWRVYRKISGYDASGCGSFMHGNPTGSSQSRRTYPEKRRTLCPKCNTVGNPGCISTWNVFHRMACRSGGTPGADNR